MWPSDVTLFPKLFTLTDWAYSSHANPWEILELWTNLGCKGQVPAVAMTNPFPDAKFRMNTSAGFSEEPGIRQGISLTGPKQQLNKHQKDNPWWHCSKSKGRQQQQKLLKNAVLNHQILFRVGLDEGCGMKDYDSSIGEACMCMCL